ncbi:hypothetical protein [Halobaculum limi]|uniref:hypothetical protein n=1 Tax=Halobaculum limi TaxID=3031916 RepID=UPI00240553C7|nr:hypothetical protein [Halobaculum sp. YSMS11]
MKHYTTSLATLLAVLALVTAGFGGVATAHTTSSIDAGTTTDGNVSITVTDATIDTSDGSLAVNIDVHNNRTSETVNVTQIEWIDSDATNTTYTLSSAESISAGTYSVLSTASSGASADRYLGEPAIGSLDGDLVVHYTVNGTSYSATTSVNLDADADQIPDSVDTYPTIGEEITTHIVNTSEGSPENAEVAFNGSTGSADVTIYKFNTTNSVYEQVYSESVDTANGSVTVSYNISSAVDGDEYMISTHGPATVDTRGLTYATDSTTTTEDSTTTTDDGASGGGAGTGPDFTDTEIVLGGLAVLAAAGLLLAGRSDN